jgi:hypothetical protein
VLGTEEGPESGACEAWDWEPPDCSANPGAPRCFVALLHGGGIAPDWTDASEEELRGYFGSEGDESIVDTLESAGCTVSLVGFDATAAFYDRAATTAADDLERFIIEEGIEDDELIVIGHSFGGLVARYVMNHGVPNAPYHTEQFELIERRTKYVISIAAPQVGAESADAVYFTADTILGNVVALVGRLFGALEGNDALQSFRRGFLEYNSAGGSFLGDEGRTTPLYTVAGYSAAQGSGAGTDVDAELSLVWELLCHQPGLLNLFNPFCDTPGDGLIEERSAYGRYTRSGCGFGDRGFLCWGGTNRRFIRGARTDWLRIEHNHQQSRLNSHEAHIKHVLSTGETREDRLGDYLAEFGLRLSLE